MNDRGARCRGRGLKRLLLAAGAILAAAVGIVATRATSGTTVRVSLAAWLGGDGRSPWIEDRLAADDEAAADVAQTLADLVARGGKTGLVATRLLQVMAERSTAARSSVIRLLADSRVAPMDKAELIVELSRLSGAEIPRDVADAIQTIATNRSLRAADDLQLRSVAVLSTQHFAGTDTAVDDVLMGIVEDAAEPYSARVAAVTALVARSSPTEFEALLGRFRGMPEADIVRAVALKTLTARRER